MTTDIYEAREAMSHEGRAALDGALGLFYSEYLDTHPKGVEESDRESALAASDRIKDAYETADAAFSRLSRIANANSPAADAFIDILAREHPYLLNEIATIVMRAVATRIARSDGHVDGRLSSRLAEHARDFYSPRREPRL